MLSCARFVHSSLYRVYGTIAISYSDAASAQLYRNKEKFILWCTQYLSSRTTRDYQKLHVHNKSKAIYEA